ncbi:MAG: DUF493 domain-containing protein [Flammeovirgaceae bacterium]|nr:DUF493 domain-containing protein [Flammeovirgaceae bacterium]
MSALGDSWGEDFLDKLNKHYSWPAVYIFKFIVPKEKDGELKGLFPQHELTKKESSQGKYSSFTVQMMMPSGEAVVEVYRKVSGIEGLIAL